MSIAVILGTVIIAQVVSLVGDNGSLTGKILGIKEVVVLFAKSLAFGLLISSTCCCYGLSVGRSATEIPQEATQAVMTSLFTVFLLDGLITYVSSFSFS